MPLDVQSLEIPEVKLVRPSIFRDSRGFFSETYNRQAFAAVGIAVDFVQDNHSLSLEEHVIRGLHYQAPPKAQDKLVRVVRGAILDVALDIRRGSPTYGRHVAVELSAQNWYQLWVPRGFAHGFCTLEPHTEIVYKVTEYYAPECDRGIAFDDPELGIAWPAAHRAALSEKDRRNPHFDALPAEFSFGEY